MTKRKKRARGRGRLFWMRMTSLIGIAAIIFSFSSSPYFKAPPQLDEQNLMTTLPPEFVQVLGSQTGSNSPSVSLQVPVLMYHYIEYVQDPNDKMRISLNIPPSIFESQIKTLQDDGYTFLNASDLDMTLAGKTKLPKKPILLTFDDGYRDFYTDAYPILKKYHAKATQYVIAGFLNRPNHLLTSQLTEIARDGLVEIGAHTMNHLWLRGLTDKTVTYEVAESRKQLRDLLRLPINSFAYPYGAFDEQAVQIVKNAGYKDAMSTIPGVAAGAENHFFLYRLRPGWRSGKDLLSYVGQDQKSFAQK